MIPMQFFHVAHRTASCPQPGIKLPARRVETTVLPCRCQDAETKWWGLMQISTNIGNNTEIGLKIGTLPNPLQNEREKPTNTKSVSKPILNFDGISKFSRSTDSALPVTALISAPHAEYRLLHLPCLPLTKSGPQTLRLMRQKPSPFCVAFVPNLFGSQLSLWTFPCHHPSSKAHS